jgi:TP901-1 family phage major tail protein
MTIQAGKDVLVKIGDGLDPQGFLAVAGLRMKTISLNARSIDVTNADSPDGWRELLGGVGVKTCSMSGAGVFVDAAADAQVRAAFFEQAVKAWQLVIPDFGVIEGAFQVAALDYSGRHDGETAWSMTLASAGALTFEAL